jgi:hypothetical protein
VIEPKRSITIFSAMLIRCSPLSACFVTIEVYPSNCLLPAVGEEALSNSDMERHRVFCWWKDSMCLYAYLRENKRSLFFLCPRNLPRIWLDSPRPRTQMNYKRPQVHKLELELLLSQHLPIPKMLEFQLPRKKLLRVVTRAPFGTSAIFFWCFFLFKISRNKHSSKIVFLPSNMLKK